MRSLYTARKVAPTCAKKAHAQQQRPSTDKNKYIEFLKSDCFKKKKKGKKTRCLGNRDKKDWKKQAAEQGDFALVEF